MADTYGVTGDIPSHRATVRSGGTVSVGAAFDTTAGLVGGFDTSAGEATEGEIQTIQSSSEAQTAFGEESELATQAELALLNGAGTVYAVGVEETTVDDETVTQSDVVENVPIFDPRVNTEHSVTVDDDGSEVTVNYVDESPPSMPTDADTANLNPNTGEIEFDAAADVEYTITYDYGDYGSAIVNLAEKMPRVLGVCSESVEVLNDALGEARNYATDFGFMHAMGGAMPQVSASDYDDTFDDRRLSVVAASRGFTDAAETEEVRTVGAIVGKQAGNELGDSTTFENVAGLTGLKTNYTNSEISTLIDKQVLPLRSGGGGVKIIKDMTTSTDVRFERIYASEIVDEATEISHIISENFIGDPNTDDNRLLLRESHTSSYEEMEADDLLEDYFVEVSKGANDYEVELDIGLDVIGIMDIIDVTISVGDVVRNGGAN